MQLKLLAGRLIDAWREFPSTRERVAAVPAGPPIFLTGTHRSGTTWLAKMLASSGIWYVHEPFAPMKGRWPEAFSFRRSEVVDPRVDEVMQDVLAGRFRAALQLQNADHPLMPLRLFKSTFRRSMTKDPLGCLLAEYLTNRFGLQTLILFRHPAGFSSSVCRLGWPRGAFLQQFLADEPLMQLHLEPYRGLLEAHAHEDTIASAAVLHGALNTVLWKFTQAGVGTPVVFEEICANPIDRLRELFAHLQLPYDGSVRDMHRAACLGEARPSGDYHPHSVARNSMKMATSWKSQLSAREAGEVRAIWERFDVPLYRQDQDWSMHDEAAGVLDPMAVRVAG